jgi:hypothetical protein
VVVLGGVHADTTDATGQFRIEAAGTGQYVLTVDHPRLRAFGLEALRVPTHLTRGRTDTASVALPSAATLRAALCRSGSSSGDVGLLGGVVLDSATGQPLSRARVTVVTDRPEVIRADHAPSRPRNRIAAGASHLEWSVELDSAGGFQVCNVPGGVPLVVRVVVPGRAPIERRLEATNDSVREAILLVP